MASERVYFVLLTFRTSYGSQIWMSPLANYISGNILLHFRFQVLLWNTIHILLFIQMDVFHALYNMIQLCIYENLFMAHGLGGIMQFPVRSDYTWEF